MFKIKRPWHSQIAIWIESSRVRFFIIGLILINAAMLGMETVPTLVQNYGDILHRLDHIILGIFVLEMILKLYAFGWQFFKNGWNLFDFFIIAIALIPSNGVFSVLRILRVFRVLRLISLMSQLRFVVEALLRALPGISSIFILLLIIYYTFAVIATTLFGPDFPEWFGTLARTMYTLFQVMTLEGWAEIARTIMTKFPYAWIFFILFILIVTFTMLNLFVAIMVNTMQTLQERRQRQMRSAIESATHSESEKLQQEIRQLRAEIGELKALLQNNKD
jgi:voltage-gated sodium channel